MQRMRGDTLLQEECLEEVGSRGGDRNINAAVDWIVVSCHWLSLVQLPGGSIIPPGEVGFGQAQALAPLPQLPFPR